MKLNHWYRYRKKDERRMAELMDNIALRSRVAFICMIPFVAINSALGLTLMTLPEEMVAPWTFEAGVVVLAIGIGAIPYYFIMIGIVSQVVLETTRAGLWLRRVRRVTFHHLVSFL